MILPPRDVAVASLHSSPKEIVDEVWQLVDRHYVDGSFNQVDWQVVRRQLLNRHYSSQEEAYRAIRHSLKLLNDPYTRFMTPQEFNALTTQTSGELSGIGIRLGLDQNTKQLTIVEPIDGSPAIQAGIQAGDRLLAIDDQPTSKMSLEEASNRIRGQAGTPIKLQLFRPNRGQFSLVVTRAVIEIPSVRYQVKEEGGQRIGYIYLSEFTSHATEQVRMAIRRLEAENVHGFVMDLRGNPGGLLQSGIDIARLWLDQGVIVRMVDRGGHSEQSTATQSALTDLPLVVLVDGQSASSSEILTGALQDHKRAIIVGNTTYGKAFVQSIHSLTDGSGLAVTVAHYYTPKGTDISQKGIVPDILVPLSKEQQQELQKNPQLWTTPGDLSYRQAILSLQETIANQGSQPSTLSNRGAANSDPKDQLALPFGGR
ncbi:S41 family peptidase [Candidatus Synechococcus calcipolaris G9]|uniref:S41 family peptidase n=1 Tax=Candidatus Synechococcus calcipolaris G9 TaxID=1497997 RepID=A0ABT6EW07_9SYNE|nr:S41 family peptidase [Candidatus Synechococcus calcipolaris]MDG2989969.1 S41 family peptidase [Candidatus Synechococcus calcipolaris G9]